MLRILYIINPAGNGGAGPKIWKQFKKFWKEDIPEKDVILTERPGHATELAEKAEYDIIVAVGGDGTVNEVIQGILKNKSNPVLSIIPAGTGNDIGSNVGIRSVEDSVKALKKCITNRYDLIQIQYKDQTRYCFLVAGFGMSANHRIKPWMKRILGSAFAYYLSAFLELILFRPWNMEIEWDNEKYSGRTTIVIIANVESTSGGSMKLGPGINPTDGEMAVTIVPFKSKFQCFFKEFPKLPKGKITEIPGIRFFRTKEIMIKSDPKTDMDIDGENLGTTPATVKILPKQIEIISLCEKSWGRGISLLSEANDANK